MTALETLRLRASPGHCQAAIAAISPHLGPGVALFRHAAFDTDLLIEIRHDSDDTHDLAQRLLWLLRPFGMVEHALWRQEEPQ